MSRATATTDHQQIRRWVEARNGHPAIVRSTQGRGAESAGLLRIDFDQSEENLKEVSWDEFFETFDANELVFLYQDKTASGRSSRFNKFVSRDAVDTQDTEQDRSAPSKSGRGKVRQASPREEEEVEEADEDDAFEEEDEDLDEDEEDEDEDEDEEDEDEEDKR
jgi:hypothetical protein